MNMYLTRSYGCQRLILSVAIDLAFFLFTLDFIILVTHIKGGNKGFQYDFLSFVTENSY